MKRYLYGKFNRLRFKQKLFLSYLAVVVIPVAVLGWYAYEQSRNMLEYQALQGIDRTVSTVADNLNQSIYRYQHTLQSIVYNRTFQKIVVNDYIDLVNLSRDLREYLSPYLIMMMNLDRDIQKIRFYTQTNMPEFGEYVLSAQRIADQSWYQAAATGTGANWYYNEGRLFVTGTFPDFVRKERDLVYLQLDATHFFSNVNEMAKTYGIVILDRDRRVIYDNQLALSPHSIAPEQIGQWEAGMIHTGSSRMLLVTKEVDRAGWTIYGLVPDAQLTSAAAGSILNATLLIIAVCLLVLVTIISIFSRTMMRGIARLHSWMKQVEEGELDLVVHSTSRDEIGELTNQFGNMLMRLNGLIEESYRSKIIQQEAELKALQYQMNPHFLYNTLSFINWRALQSDDRQISHVVTMLAKFYRTALNRGNKSITIRDELDNIRAYLEIIQVMGEHAFDVRYEVDEAVFAYSTINLILQPLAENAIKHGIHPLEDRRGSLIVRARLHNDCIELEVADNGPGMDTAQVEALLHHQSPGYGLRNVHDRIGLMFGKAYGLVVQSTPGQGTVMTLRFPLYLINERGE